MRDLPDGYGIWWIADATELTTPQGERFSFNPEDSYSRIVDFAWKHKADNYDCIWEPMCPVCEDRRRRAA
jgi:hypothetical protein